MIYLGDLKPNAPRDKGSHFHFIQAIAEPQSFFDSGQNRVSDLFPKGVTRYCINAGWFDCVCPSRPQYFVVPVSYGVEPRGIAFLMEKRLSQRRLKGIRYKKCSRKRNCTMFLIAWTSTAPSFSYHPHPQIEYTRRYSHILSRRWAGNRKWNWDLNSATFN